MGGALRLDIDFSGADEPMANDRVMIKCKGCGKSKMLLKFYPGGSTHRDNWVLDWLDNHRECHPRCFEDDLGGDPGFILETESEKRG